MTAPRIAVIGSGLGAVSAARALAEKGHHPVIFDTGLDLDPDRRALSARMAATAPEDWTDTDIAAMSYNPTLDQKGAIPRKLHLGSGYFYGQPNDDFPLAPDDGDAPPFSFAKGGMSAGWGASVLIPQQDDLVDWPIPASAFHAPARKVLAHLPYSAAKDDLDRTFPTLADATPALAMADGDRRLLGALRRALPDTPDEVAVGQARLLVRAAPDPNAPDKHPCQYCGHCMAGCVYGSIYKSSDTLDALVTAGAVTYRPGHTVLSLARDGDATTITLRTPDGTPVQERFDRVFMGAGAVNSTRIYLASRGAFGQELTLRSRAGIVVPVLSLRPLRFDWPRVNTQPSIFLEFRSGVGAMRHWVHTQISTTNEIVLKKLGVDALNLPKPGSIKRRVLEHAFVAFCNFHSRFADDYRIALDPPHDSAAPRLRFSRGSSNTSRRYGLRAMLRLSGLLLRAGCLPVLPLAKHNRLAFHVGGTLPMRTDPKTPFELDILGQPADWPGLHFIDSTGFPTLPGTTIGLLIMANAQRVVDDVA